MERVWAYAAFRICIRYEHERQALKPAARPRVRPAEFPETVVRTPIPHRREFGLVLLLIPLALAACGGGGGPEAPGASPFPLEVLASRFPVDGKVEWSALSGIRETTVDFLPSTGGSAAKRTTLRWAFANDDRDLYVALQWTDDTWNHAYDRFAGPLDFDGVKLLFDDDGDGVWELGEDARMVFAGSVSSQYIDQHVSADDETDAIGDGFGKLRWDARTRSYEAEFLFPLVPDAAGQDARLSEHTRYAILLFDHVQMPALVGNVARPLGNEGNARDWPRLPLAPAEPTNRPGPPADLGGLIAFTSTHENPDGDVYVFDPRTRVTTRVTNTPGLMKENVSLSWDRTRVAFHGAPDRYAFAEYEIYVVNVDGSGLRQLTDNSLLDGHPAWCPTDDRIAYASFRDPEGASIVVMDTDGVEIADLTPPGVDDNDAEYLPDGRITFKTDRFSTTPQLRIAVMDADGTNVEPLTFVEGVSDHDPAGAGEHVLFERFLKPTNYAEDLESGFTPWDLVEARLDGTGERTILHDGWVNWLPVADPTGSYIAYLKSCGYTSVHLVTREGVELGRLVPDLTRMTYLDWK
jgi:hypothetical protein